MSSPREAWHPYVKNVSYRYPHNRHPEENAAVKEALKAARPDARPIIELVYIRKTKTLREAANLCFMSYSTAHRRNMEFIRNVAKNLKLPGTE